jgi:hypothetical protein
MSRIVNILEIVIDHTPVIGKLKTVIERDYPQRPLSISEIQEPRWLSEYLAFINRVFRGTAYDQPYMSGQVEDWLGSYPEALVVLVKKHLVSWPPGSEKIVGSIKMLPLKKDLVALPGFDPFTITGKQLATNLMAAQAVWVGDLVSTRTQLLLLVMTVRDRLERIGIPVYCRTDNKELRRILFERYGARVLRPDGRPANGSTILVLHPSAVTKRIKPPGQSTTKKRGS